jgi:hypothetical protein
MDPLPRRGRGSRKHRLHDRCACFDMLSMRESLRGISHKNDLILNLSKDKAAASAAGKKDREKVG